MKFSRFWEVRSGYGPLSEETEIQPFATREWAHRWLLGHRGDQFRMAEFRRLLARANHSSLDRCGDDEVLRLLGSEIGSGRFRLVRTRPAPLGRGAENDDSVASPPGQPGAPPPAPRPRAPEPALEEPTFPAGADPIAIAAAQQEAALLGVPFCEECARKALANALS
jgi:hypothetical protein